MKFFKFLINKFNLLFICLFFIVSFSFADSSYTVKKGDTLYSISRKYEITVAELRTANNLGENDILREGVRLVVPTADISNAAALSSYSDNSATTKNSKKEISSNKTQSYIVQKGDTLYGIARKNNIKLPELLSINNIDTTATIRVGQKLLIPCSIENNNNIQKEKIINNSTEKIIQENNSVNLKGITWPLLNPIVKNINGKVSGVQLIGKDNESVKVVHEGTVMYTGIYRGFGEVVFIQSKTGLIYSYSGLEKVVIKKGDYVVLGDEIGKTGKGNDTSIKFMVFQNGMPVDPVKAPRG